MDKRKKGIYLVILIIAIIAIILAINYLKENNSVNEETIKCIAGKSKLYVSKTCSACAAQKNILGEYVNYFDMIDCATDTDRCVEENITRVPTWVINSQKSVGVKSLKELKSLAGC